jgi:hypothetical protein
VLAAVVADKRYLDGDERSIHRHGPGAYTPLGTDGIPSELPCLRSSAIIGTRA